MKKYRKPDQFYIDMYDRSTIALLKDIEKEVIPPQALTYSELLPDMFLRIGIERMKQREDTLRVMMETDEQKDLLVNRYPAPKNVICDTCDLKTLLCAHLFPNAGQQITFVFECVRGHLPLKIVDSEGNECGFPARKCIQCGFEVLSRIELIVDTLRRTDKCTVCGLEDVAEFKLMLNDEITISDQDRNKYCLSFIGKSIFWDDLHDLCSKLILIDQSNNDPTVD